MNLCEDPKTPAKVSGIRSLTFSMVVLCCDLFTCHLAGGQSTGTKVEPITLFSVGEEATFERALTVQSQLS